MAAGKLADKTEEKEMAEADELGIPFTRSAKVISILKRKKDLEDMSGDMTLQSPQRGVPKWLSDLWITA